MPKANALKKGNVVKIGEQLYIAVRIEVKTPSARGASTLYKVRFTNLQTKLKMEETYKGEDFLQEVDLERRAVQFLYREDEMYTFMDQENYEQYTLAPEDLEGQEEWISNALEGIVAMLIDGKIIGIDLPQSVELEITETAPAMKNASATSRTKPATLANGVEVQVPEYLAPGEVVKVNTETGKFMSRA